MKYIIDGNIYSSTKDCDHRIKDQFHSEVYMDVKITHENNHVVVRDSLGNFLFSADTWQEAMRELESEVILTA
jgi:hypothetical protein